MGRDEGNGGEGKGREGGEEKGRVGERHCDDKARSNGMFPVFCHAGKITGNVSQNVSRNNGA